jgi:foldase protein PrsA
MGFFRDSNHFKFTDFPLISRIDAIFADSYNPPDMDVSALGGAGYSSVSLAIRRLIMGEGNHLTVPGSKSQPKGRNLTMLVGGAAGALLATGLLMQYVRSPASKAAETPAGQARVGTAPKSEVYARVGDDSISYDALAKECVNRFGREVLDDLVHRLIIQQACEQRQVTVTEKEIDDEINRIAKRFQLDVAQWLQMLQAERNISPTQYRQSVIFPMIALKKLADKDVDVTEKDVNEAFVRNYGPRVKARAIMLNNLRRANGVWDQLQKNPEEFEELAAKVSDDPNSRALGGQVPPISRFNGSPELEKAAFALKAGQISGVVEVSPSRYVILKCEGRTEPVVTEIDEVRDALYDEIKESKTQAQIAKTFEEIKKNTVVDNYLTQYTNRPERGASATGASASVQPAAGTQTKTNRVATTTAAPAKNAGRN